MTHVRGTCQRDGDNDMFSRSADALHLPVALLNLYQADLKICATMGSQDDLA